MLMRFISILVDIFILDFIVRRLCFQMLLFSIVGSPLEINFSIYLELIPLEFSCSLSPSKSGA